MEFIDLKKQYSIIEKDVKQNIDNVLSKSNYILGEEVNDLEKKLSKYVGTRFCVTCSSGTDALILALMTWNIGPGDAVITSPFSYIATSEAIRLVGATPVFVDINKDTFNINVEEIDNAIIKIDKLGLKPKAVIPVNIFGLCADFKMIEEKAKKYNLLILEDAAQSFGATYFDKKSCSLGDISATSFFPAKPLGCYGDGGAIFTDNEKYYEKLLSLRVHGKGVDKYDNIRNGINGRLDTIQAAVLISKLKIFPDELKSRNIIANKYYNRLKNDFSLQKKDNNYISSFAQFSILCNDDNQRSKILENLKEKKIPAVIYYRKPLHLQTVNIDLKYKVNDLPISEDISNRIFSIPMHPYLDDDKINYICNAILEII